ncbi:MAG: AAA family ATPase [Actinomycetes bacterium]
MTGVFGPLVAWLQDLPPRAVVAVDGPSGAGKTELVAHLERQLTGSRRVAVVHLDDIYPGWDGLEQAVSLVAEHVLAPWAEHVPNAGAVVPVWDWVRAAAGPRRPVPDGDLLLLDGVGSGAESLAPWRHGLIWLEAPEEIRRSRALARDGDTYRPHWERWATQERRHFARERTRDRADWVLEASEVSGPPAARP